MMPDNRKIFLISFIVNIVFSMITALLALIVYTINHNIYDVNYIMTAFISTLVLTRILLVKVQLSPSFQVILGSFLFTFGCLFLTIFSDCFAMVFIGALLFGMAIGFIAPALLTMLTDSNAERNIGIYNTIVAIASIFSPLIGEKFYAFNSLMLFTFWLILSILMTILSIMIKEKNTTLLIGVNKDMKNISVILSNRAFKEAFWVLLFSSISYGSIVSYLPIYFKKMGFSIGIYYLLFWSGYIFVQFLRKSVANDKIIFWSILGISLGQLTLVFFDISYIIYISSIVYGMGYGTLFKIFYLKIGLFSKKYTRNLAFSIIGLISYLGVGLAPIFLLPFNVGNWRTLFLGNLLYCLIALALFVILERKKYGTRC